jgi:hypothetical protein
LFSSLVSFLPHWVLKTKPKRQDAVFGPLLITSTSANLVIGIVFIVSNFVVTVFPKVTAKLVGVWLRTGQSSSQLSTTRELKNGIASLRKTAVSPAQVENDIGNMSPDIGQNNPTPLLSTRVVPMESLTVKPKVEAGCMDHNYDIVDQGIVRGRETQWNGNLKQNLDRSAVALPVEETIPVERIFISSKTRKLTSILSHGRSARQKDDTFL